MKISKLFLSLFLLFSSVTVASAFHVRPVQVWCENSETWTHAFLVFDDNGNLRGASGIDCDGNAWSKSYGVYTGPNQIQAWIAGISSSTLHVSADQSLDVQLVNLSSDGGSTIGNIQHITAANQPIIFNLAVLDVGTYGVLVTKDGATVDMLTFDKR